jgi:hypothetical protein
VDLVKFELLGLVLVNASLVAVVVFQQLFWARQVQKLIDKLMSKSFVEYTQCVEPKPIDQRERKVQVEHSEDLGIISGG